MGGTFHSKGRGYAWKRDDVVVRQQEAERARKVADYKARVMGRKVVITSAIDFGKEGEIVDFVDGMFAVRFGDEKDPHFFDRDELEPVR